MSTTLSQPSAVRASQLNESSADKDSFMTSLSRKLSRSLTLQNGGELAPDQLTPREDPVEKWEKWIAINKVSPDSRLNQVGVAYDGFLVVFGGCGGSLGSERSNYVYKRSLLDETAMWKKVNCGGIPPPPGSGGTATLVKNEMWLYGGENQYNTSKRFGKRRDVHGDMHVLNHSLSR